jgi:hypothetical protein
MRPHAVDLTCDSRSGDYKTSILWTATSRSALEVSRRFGGICDFHLHSRKVRQAGKQKEARGQPILLALALEVSSQRGSVASCS